MSTPGGLNTLLLASAAGVTPPAEYQIERSLRFNSSDSAYEDIKSINRIEYALTNAQLQEVAA